MRIFTEEVAVDSYQNLLFPLLEYNSMLNRWPKHITLISHDFKRRRFEELHCPAIRWPLENLTYVGIDPPDDVVPRDELDLDEFNKGYEAFRKDPYGVRDYLKDKREDRGGTIGAQLLKVCHEGIPEDVKPLLMWKGGDTQCGVFRGPLPWDPEGFVSPTKGTPVHSPQVTPSKGRDGRADRSSPQPSPTRGRASRR